MLMYFYDAVDVWGGRGRAGGGRRVITTDEVTKDIMILLATKLLVKKWRTIFPFHWSRDKPPPSLRQ